MRPVTGALGKKDVWAGSLAVLILLAAFSVARPAFAVAILGDLDKSFDEDGKVVTSFGYEGRATAVALQPDGKIVAAGGAIDTPGGGFEDFALARYNANGSPDTSFGSGGKTVTKLSNYQDRINDMEIGSDGKIAAVGFAENDASRVYEGVLTRYNANGSLDTSFGSGGKVTSSFGDRSFNPQAVVPQPDGKIVIAGVSGHDFVLIRYNANGSPDTSFGAGGKAVTDFDLGYESLNDLAVQPNGKIVAVGSSYTSDWRNENFALARYNANGSPDTSFDGDGKLTTDTGSVEERANNVAIQTDGKIVVAGHSYIGDNISGHRELALIRYNPDGSFDASFDGDGRLNTPGAGEYAEDLLLLSDGKILVLGRGGYNEINFVRYDTGGSLDGAFGEGGKVNTWVSGGYMAQALAIQPDGRMVTAGGATGANNLDGFGLTRHYAGGEETTSPGPVTGLGATSLGTRIDLAWTNPTDADYSNTRVFRSEIGHATSPLQAPGQTKIYQGTGTTFEDDGLADGTYYYTAFAVDTNGNWSEAATASARARYVTAYATITSGPTHYENVASRSATFGFTSSEEGATFQCSLDDGPFEACTSPKEYTGLADSERPDGSAGTIPPHVFRVRAVVDGIAGRGESRYWYVDATAPTVEFIRGPYGAVNTGFYNRTDPATFMWNTSYDLNGSRFECSLDGAPFQACTEEGSYGNLADGEHDFRVRAIDRLGNTGEASRSWVVDTVAPETTISSGPSGNVSAGTASFELSSAGGGSPVTFRCRLDGAAFTACDPSKKYADLANGEHTFFAQATDRAGNVGPVQSWTWTVAPDRANEEVGAGGTLTTDADGEAGATSFDPVETTITSPVAGLVSIEESAAVTQSSAGYSLLGQQVNIEAPSSTADNPLRFAFVLDSTLIPAGENQDTVQVFRNGARVEACTGTSGTASPDPCVVSRNLLTDGDVEFTVLTSHASAWNLGVVDRVAPTVKAVTPSNLAKNVSATTNVTATFSEAMMKSTVNKGTFYLTKKGTATRIPATVSYSATAKKATLNPGKSLRARATYTATVTGGTQDAGGNALTRNMSWTFTIRR